jgi:hypothetical protein
VYLPYAPQGVGGEDAVESSTGTRCRSSMNSNGAYVDFGVTGVARLAGANQANSIFADSNRSEAIGYFRMIVPLGKKPERIDCSELYRLEIERLHAEIEQMKIGLK